jgi:hypothetical protein
MEIARRRVPLLVGLIAAFFLMLLMAGLVQAQSVSGSQATSAIEPPLCRLGINSTLRNSAPITQVDTPLLRLSWYLNYNASARPARPNGIEYAPMIRIKQTGANSYRATPSGAALQSVIANNPGADWMIGNEPDRRKWQDDLEPHIYALAYHDLYQVIKQADPTAQIFAGTIVQPTPLRLKYLDLVLQSYQSQFGAAMPVDGWAIHNFILNEASCEHFPATECWGAEIPPGLDEAEGLRLEADDNDDFDLFTQQIFRFRLWMNSRGYRGAPLYLSEYGVLMPDYPPFLVFPPERVNQFMNRTFDYLLNASDPTLGDPSDGHRLVQRLAWYSTDDYNFNGFLFERDMETEPFRLSAMGENWVNYTRALTPTVDLYPLTVTSSPSAPLAAGGNVTLTLTMQVANSGHTFSPHTAAVRFYDGDPANGGELIGGEQMVTLSGCGDEATASVQWPNVAPGIQRVYVSVDPAGSIVETNEQNNVTSHLIVFVTNHLFLPLVQRPFAIE